MKRSEILLETGTNELEILEFHIEQAPDSTGECTVHSFGVNVAKVMEVIESPGLTHEPSASHPSYLGIIPLRGHILPVVDLSIWLGIDRKPDPHDIVIVTEFSKSVTGFLVSGVTGIHRLGWAEVIPPDGYMPKTGIQAVIGMVEREDHFIQLLDLETILSDLTPESELDDPEPLHVAPRTLRALVADDSATIRLMLQKSLTRANFELTVVNNGQEALHTLRSLAEEAQRLGKSMDQVMDIVISDIEMPLMDGFTLTKNIKNDPALGGLPVILYSSIITEELRHKGESVGANCQISKPDLARIPEMAISLVNPRNNANG
jgi:two-component system, chemotaxis family, chemotaxis protein CheV